jgi:hypothetical protein
MYNSRLPQNLKPVCSVNGKIEQFLLFYRCPVSENPLLAGQHFSALIEKIGNDVMVFIEVQLPHGTGIAELPQPSSSVCLIPVNPDDHVLMNGLTSWVQDVILSFEDSAGKPVLLFDEKRVDAIVLELLSRAIPGMRFFPYPSENLAGGNLMPVTDAEQPFLLAGADIASGFAERGFPDDTIVIGLRQLFGITTILWPGSSVFSGALNNKQPLFHIDLYLCPLGRLACAPEFQHILVAELTPETCLQGWSAQAAQLAQALNQTAVWLESAPEGIAFKVIRVPLFVFDSELRHIGSCANAVAENINGCCRVFLPDYTPPNPLPAVEHNLKKAIRSIQQRTEIVLLNAGIQEVLFIDGNYFTLSEREGALHCHSKVIARSA